MKPPFIEQKPIMTFMRRTSPLNTSQKLALEQYAELKIDFSEQSHDILSQFDNPEQPLTLEIGFGMGRSLMLMARDAPERNFLGIEVHQPGIAQCMYECGMAELKNVRIIEGDAIAVLNALPDNSIDCLQLFFPDPWQKKRHHKRRFVSHSRMPLVEQKLAIGGRFHAATDWEPYAEWMLEVLENRPRLQNLAGKNQPYPRPEWRPITKFERRGVEAGHPIADFIFEKIK